MTIAARASVRKTLSFVVAPVAMALLASPSFAKKANQDYQFLAMTEFLQQYLLQ